MTWDVITVTLNAEKEISRCINSVKKQKQIDAIHTIFDGGSKDSTKTIIRSELYEGLQLVLGRDQGIYDALNQAIATTSNEFVAILHSDDYFDDELVLKHIQECFEQNPSVEIVFCRVNYRDKEHGRSIRCSEVPNSKYLKYFFLLGGQLAHPGIFVRRNVYHHLVYHDDFKISADYLFQLKCFFDFDFQFIGTTKASVTQQTGGTSQKNLTAFRIGKIELYKAWRIYLGRSPFAAGLIVCLNIMRKIFMHLKRKIERKKV